MATPRGLNKGRGLSALISPNKKSVENDKNEEKNITSPTNSSKPVKPEKNKPTFEEKQASNGKNTPTKNKTLIDKKDNAPTLEENSGENKAQSPTLQAVSLSVFAISPAPGQPRKQFDEETIAELAASIREHGVITPLLVRQQGDRYELIAGERRWRAAKQAGLTEVPVLIRTFSEQEAREIALIENIQREDLNAIEEAMAYQSLLDEFHLRQEEIAQRVSKSRSAVANALRLLKLEKSVQQMLAEGQISKGHARALLVLEEPEAQRVTAERIVGQGLSVRDTEKLVNRLSHPTHRGRSRTNTQLAAVYEALEEDLRKALGTRVAIHPMRGKKGKVEIEYYSQDDLERIIDRLRQGGTA